MLHLTSATDWKPAIKLENTGATGYGAYLEFHQTSTASEADGDYLGVISWTGVDSGDAVERYAYIAGQTSDVTTNDEAGKLSFVVNVDAVESELFTINGFNGSVVGQAEVIVNEPGLDSDFRVESNDQTHMLFVDGGTNKVGIGTASPDTLLEAESASHAGIQIKTTDANTISYFSAKNDAVAWQFRTDGGSSDSLMMYLDGTGSKMTITTAGNVGIGDTSPDGHLDVEDLTVTTAVNYSGIRSTHTITDGAHDASDTLFGLAVTMAHNDADKTIGPIYGAYLEAQAVNSTGESSNVFGCQVDAVLIAGDHDNIYGLGTTVDVDAGAVDADIYGNFVNVDVESGISNVANIIGHSLTMDCDTDPSGQATGYFMNAGSNMNYSARFYDTPNSTYRINMGALSGNIDAEGSVAASQSLDYAEYFESSDGSVIAHGITVKLDGGKIVACEEGDTPLGVIRPKTAQTIVGGSQVFHWAEKFVKDDYGGDIMEDYTMTKWSEEITFDEYVARGKDSTGGVEGGIVTDSKVEGSKAITAKDAVTQQKTVDEEVEEEVTTTELVDGKYVQKTETVTKTVKVPQYDEEDLYDEDGEVIGKHQVPIMETVEEAVAAVDAVAETYFREHKYQSDKLPEGVTVPDDAETITPTNKRQKVNPDYAPDREYSSREDRDEWHIVGLLGQIPITKGQPLADNWTKMKDVSDTVEMYFVK
jgi:hypothetical protein